MFALLGLMPPQASAEVVEYRYGSTTYPTLPDAESAMRWAIGPAGSYLRLCSAADGTGGTTALDYCTPLLPANLWHHEYSVPGGSTPSCGHSNDRLADYCASEAQLVAAYVAIWEASNPTRCISNQYAAGDFVDPPVSTWAINSYNPGTGTKRFASLSHNNPVYGDRRKAMIEHKPCADLEATPSTLSFFVNWAEHQTCPTGFEPKKTSALTWPVICEGPTATITKLAPKAATTSPRSCAPCVPATGEKLVFESDFEWGEFNFRRTYASMRDEPSGSALDQSWSHTWNESLKPTTATGSLARVWWKNELGDVDEYRFVASSTTALYSVNTNSRRLYKESGSQWRLRDEYGIERLFDPSGRLIRITSENRPESTIQLAYSGGRIATATDARGRQLEFEHADGRLVQIRIAGGQPLVAYTYDSQQHLASATYPGGKQRSYLYAESANVCIGAGGGCSAGMFPNRITGVIDENNVRVLDVTYDGNGRVVESTRPLGDQATSLTYSPTTMQREMAIAGQGTADYLFEASAYRRPLSKALYDVSTLIGTETWEYPTNKLSTRYTNRRNVATRRLFNAAGLQTELIEAERQGSNTNLPEKRTTEITWSTGALPQPLVTEIRNAAGVPVLREEVAYNGRGQVASRTLVDPATSEARATVWTYCEASDVADPLADCPIEGLVKSITAPGGAVTTFRYRSDDHSGCAISPAACEYRRGDLWQTTGPEGHVVEILAYDAAGRAVAMLDPTGVRTDVGFDARGRLETIAVGGATSGDDAVTTLAWTDTGLLASVVDPDGVVLVREYDDAGRLVALQDSLGNRQELTLDAGGNPIQENVRDAADVVVRSLSRVFDGVSRATSEADAFANATAYSWDANGNLLTVTDAATTVTQNTYDRLDRLVGIVQDVGGIAASVAIEYDALDRVTKVTDPKGLDTGYTYNAFGELLELDSPDTGTTAFTYDAAGRLATREDARGVVTSYTHDDLGRVTAVDYPGSGEDVAYTWDTVPGACGTGETFGAGRLGTMVDGSGSTAYCHDRRGNRVRKVQVTGGVTLQIRYGYTLADRLAWVEYPDGTRVDYGRNANGDAASAAVTRPGQPQQSLVSGVDWHPFGPPAAIEWASGRLQLRDQDAAGRPVMVTDGEPDALTVDFGFSAVGDLTSITEPAGMSPPDVTLSYDALGRLTGFLDGPTSVAIETYGYDATGNRTSFENSAGLQAYNYPVDSHRLASVAGAARTYDAAGNTLTIGAAWTYTYGHAGRMATASDGTVLASYSYTGAGEQVRRVAGGGSTTLFVYDEVGQLLGQYDGAGNPIQQYVWLDTLPVGVISGTTVYHVQPDHLGTPRAVIDPGTDTVIWSWSILGEAFGSTIPNEDPDGNSVPFVFDLRFPGQRHDAASGLNQNYLREYEPGRGGYTQPDPIGLDGGISAYSYVGANPLSLVDPTGLRCVSANGFTVCQFPNGPSFRLPTPAGFPQTLERTDLLYHKYDVQRPIGCADANEVMQALINNPTPGTPRPATARGTPNNAVVAGRNNFVTSYLTKDLNTGQPIVVNITGSAGLFGPGYVARTVTNGVAHTYGEGTNWKQSPGLWGTTTQEIANEILWGQQMSKLIEQCGCGK